MSDVGKFISMVGLHFPPPRKVDDPEYSAWLTSMTISLRHYPDSVLAAAAAEIVETRTSKDGKFFPLPSECKAVCDRHDRITKAEQTPLLTHSSRDHGQFSGWRIKLADDLVKSPMGKQAAKEGWVLSLHDFARNEGRLPTGSEIARCKHGARDFDESYADLVRDMGKEPAPPENEAGGTWTPLGETQVIASLVRLGDSMLAKREDLRSKVLGERA